MKKSIKSTTAIVQPKFKSHYNSHFFPKQKEIVNQTQPSLTVPNQSMTIQEIYKRFASGRPLSGVSDRDYDYDGVNQHGFDFDDIMPDISKMDLADRQEILENAKLELDEVKRRLDSIARARKQQADKKQADLEKKIKELEDRQNTQSGQNTQNAEKS